MLDGCCQCMDCRCAFPPCSDVRTLLITHKVASETTHTVTPNILQSNSLLLLLSLGLEVLMERGMQRFLHLRWIVKILLAMISELD